ncbi:U3 small nucleolar RNA-associated protein [Apophysomyces sp. BC1034]|nr:U3 small nucleolar RNA-associated protein [Apophysomyces sp. BC1015]KAG0174065.1 U3 small nucleolar RNA-associated protein [Apophysomyces sp. BC1021]KAG0185677.1 U3 small nucleolar RNA-associated protein [Apophysomyces sp. BC1034]
MEVHRCRFVEYQPAAINALDFTPSTVDRCRLAVGRANGNIEIWDPSHRYRLEKTIPGGQGLSVESLVWAHQSVVVDQDEDDEPEEIAEQLKHQLEQSPRLFSSGLNPYIVEWDTTSLTAKRSVDSNGGAVWCLAVNSTGTRLAAGCEDGRIRLFDISNNQFEYIRNLEPQKGRILSVAWSPDDDYIVSGGSDSAIRKWDVTTGSTIQRMTVDRVRKEPTLVWSVAATRNNTIISGDSLGNLMFWDAERGAMRQSFRAHGADILSIAVSRDGDLVFSAGVDRKLCAFRRVKQNNKTHTKAQWLNIGSRRYHWHDIRALALDDRPSVNSIVSGGVDVELVSCPAREFPKLIQNRLPPFPHKYIISISKIQKLVMATFENSISLWQLGKAGELDLTSRQTTIPEMLKPHQLMLDLQLKADCNITSSALSEDAQWIAVGDIENVRLFRLQASGHFNVKKVRDFESALNKYLAMHNAAAGAHHVSFTPGSEKLIIVTSESRILVVDILGSETEKFKVLREFGHHRGLDSKGNAVKGSKVATVITLAVSSDGQWLATGDDDNQIHVFNLDSLQHHITLPRFSSPHTALSFNEFRSKELFIGLATNEFYIYNVEQNKMTDWSYAHLDQSNSRLLNMRDRIRGVAYNPAEEEKMIIYGSTYMCQIDMSKGRTRQISKAQKRKAGQEDVSKRMDTENSFDTALSREYQHILSCGFLDKNCMVMIERPKFSVLEKLPPSFYKAHFAT